MTRTTIWQLYRKWLQSLAHQKHNNNNNEVLFFKRWKSECTVTYCLNENLSEKFVLQFYTYNSIRKYSGQSFGTSDGPWEPFYENYSFFLLPLIGLKPNLKIRFQPNIFTLRKICCLISRSGIKWIREFYAVSFCICFYPNPPGSSSCLVSTFS